MNLAQALSQPGMYQHTFAFGKPRKWLFWRHSMIVRPGNRLSVSVDESFDAGSSWKHINYWKGTVTAVDPHVEDESVWVLTQEDGHNPRSLPARGWRRMGTR